MRAGWKRAAAGAVLALGLAACGGGQGEEQQPDSIEAYLGLGDEATSQDLERRLEEAVAACMKAQGFDYQPVNSAEMVQAQVGGEDLSPEEYAATYGYGITTYEEAGDESGSTDPNQATYEALSEAEREAWDTALWGDTLDVEAEEAESFTPGGCYGEAWDEVYGKIPAELQQALMAMEEQVSSDPRYVKAEAEWAGCMRRAGHEFASTDEPVDAIGEKAQAQFTDLRAAAADDDAADLDTAAWDALRAEEIAVAKADQACRAEFLSPELEEEIRADVERRFIAEHRAELDAVREQIGG